MKTTIKAKVVIETNKYCEVMDGRSELEPLTLVKIEEEIRKGHYIIEWINSFLSHEQEPTIIIKL